MNGENNKILKTTWDFPDTIPSIDVTFPITFSPEHVEPTYDITITVKKPRIWWKPWTWFGNRDLSYTLEKCTIDTTAVEIDEDDPTMRVFQMDIIGNPKHHIEGTTNE